MGALSASVSPSPHVSRPHTWPGQPPAIECRSAIPLGGISDACHAGGSSGSPPLTASPRSTSTSARPSSSSERRPTTYSSRRPRSSETARRRRTPGATTARCRSTKAIPTSACGLAAGHLARAGGLDRDSWRLTSSSSLLEAGRQAGPHRRPVRRSRHGDDLLAVAERVSFFFGDDLGWPSEVVPVRFVVGTDPGE